MSCDCLSWCWRLGDLESEDQGFSSHVFPVASCPLTHGSETWVLIAGLTFLGTHSFFVGNSILKLVEDCNIDSLGGDFWSWQSDTLSLWGLFPAGLCGSGGCTPFPLYAFFLPSPGGHPFIAHSTQVSFWVLAWKYPNVTFWFRIPSTCMMKSLNFSLPHFLLKRIWKLSALTA